MEHLVRKASMTDHKKIFSLYQIVARDSGGLARRPDEISLKYIETIIGACSRTGLILALVNKDSLEIDGLIHAEGSEIQDLRHILSHLTFLIRPHLQGQGLGKALFTEFLRLVQRDFPHIYRVELRARASNTAALGLYESLGFQREGLFRKRIMNREGHLEDGIPMVWFNIKRMRAREVVALGGNCE